MSKTYLNSSSQAISLNTVILLQEVKYNILLDLLVSITRFLGILYKKFMSNGSLVPTSENKTATKVPPTKTLVVHGHYHQNNQCTNMEKFLVFRMSPNLLTTETLASVERKVVWWRQCNLIPCNLIYAPVLFLFFLTDIIFKRYFWSSQHTRLLRLWISVLNTHLRQKSVIHPTYLIRNFSIRLSNLGATHYIARYCSMRSKSRGEGNNFM